jgi:hypothetical protein
MPPLGTAGAGAVLRSFANQSEPIPSPPGSGLRQSQTTASHHLRTALQRPLGARLSCPTTNSAQLRLETGRGYSAVAADPKARAARARPTEREDRKFEQVTNGVPSVGGVLLELRGWTMAHVEGSVVVRRTRREWGSSGATPHKDYGGSVRSARLAGFHVLDDRGREAYEKDLNPNPLDAIESIATTRTLAGNYRFARCGEGFALASTLRIPVQYRVALTQCGQLMDPDRIALRLRPKRLLAGVGRSRDRLSGHRVLRWRR